MRFRPGLIGLVAVFVALAGCHPLQRLRNVGGNCHDPKPYQKAGSIAPLKIPPVTPPATSIPASFVFQTTDSTTNALTGTANTPVEPPAVADTEVGRVVINMPSRVALMVADTVTVTVLDVTLIWGLPNVMLVPEAAAVR